MVHPLELPTPTPEAVKYYHVGIACWIAWLVWGFLVPGLFLFTGWSARCRDFAWRRGKRWYFAFVLYLICYTLFSSALETPLAFLTGFVREHAFHLSHQTLAKWVSDELKGLGIAIVAGALFLWVPFRLMRRFPRRWWAILCALIFPYFCFVMFIQPIWIAPLFNHFGPMKDKALETQILDLAGRAGIEGARVYEVNKSVDTDKINAYVTGFLGTKRIVLWDTTIKKLDTGSILSVMGHEMGHYVLQHVAQGIAVFGFLTCLAIYLIYVTGGWAIQRFGARVGLSALSDFASLPLILLLLSLYSFVLTPVGLAFSRHWEHEADRFALEITRDNDAFLRTEIAFVEKDLGYPRPGPIIKYLRYSHPTTGERFDFAKSYRPWEKGEPLKYEKYFHPLPSQKRQ